MSTPFRCFILGATLLTVGLPNTARSQSATQDPATAPPALKPGDAGAAVEVLQRTLNAQADLMAQPGAAPLDADGDYGDGTRAAVVRFQRIKGLPTTGLADAATRKALGPPPPPTAEPPVLAPAVVNAEIVPRKPAEPLDGPPAVLSPAWAIADGKTGDLLWGENAARPV